MSNGQVEVWQDSARLRSSDVKVLQADSGAFNVLTSSVWSVDAWTMQQ